MYGEFSGATNTLHGRYISEFGMLKELNRFNQKMLAYFFCASLDLTEKPPDCQNDYFIGYVKIQRCPCKRGSTEGIPLQPTLTAIGWGG